jgi:hypothetical protein
MYRLSVASARRISAPAICRFPTSKIPTPGCSCWNRPLPRLSGAQLHRLSIHPCGTAGRGALCKAHEALTANPRLSRQGQRQPIQHARRTTDQGQRRATLAARGRKHHPGERLTASPSPMRATCRWPCVHF